jgi:hypothetical protein
MLILETGLTKYEISYDFAEVKLTYVSVEIPTRCNFVI